MLKTPLLHPSPKPFHSPPSLSRPKKPFHLLHSSSSSPSSSNPDPQNNSTIISSLLEAPKTIWKQTLKPLSDFGFGKRSIWEGGVGLFMVTGAAVLALTLAWLRGFQLRSRFRKYEAVFEFDQACGICVGTPVRIRGVTVGNVVRVDSSLKSIDATVQVEDDKIIIPKSSLIEVNQSGLLMETLIDITPRKPLPEPSFGPLDSSCSKEGLILCDRERMKGQTGVSLDEMVGIFTRLGREMEQIGIKKGYDLAEKVAGIMQDAQPLLEKMEIIAENIQPILSEVGKSELIKDVETITKSLADVTKDFRKVQTSVLMPDNSDMIRQSVYSLIFTLKNIESITSDISGFTRDEATTKNIKLLIKSLSRLL